LAKNSVVFQKMFEQMGMTEAQNVILFKVLMGTIRFFSSNRIQTPHFYISI